jgi:hypothetical protein
MTEFAIAAIICVLRSDLSDQQPKLKLTFMGDGFPNGAVPLTVVASKLQALQQALFHAAAAASAHRGERRGPWSNRYRAVAELSFESAHHSDLTIEAALATNPVLSEEFDIGRKAVDLLFDVAIAVQDDNIAALRPGTLPEYDRDYLIRAVEGLMPNLGDQYQVKLENCRPDRHPVVTFDGTSRLRVRGYAVQTEATFEAEEAVVVGELIKIHVDAGDDKITVRSRQRDIDCFYGDALRDQVANLIAGSIVEVSGFATFDSAQQVLKLHRMLDVQPVSMEPLRIARFEHDGRVFTLQSPIAVNVEYTDGLWVYHHPELNLWGYAARREDALRDLHQTFAYVYHDIAEDNEENLDAVARQLRERLLRLVSKPSGDAVHA